MHQRQQSVLDRIRMCVDALKRAYDAARDDPDTVDLIYVDKQLTKAKCYAEDAISTLVPWASAREELRNPPRLFDYVEQIPRRGA